MDAMVLKKTKELAEQLAGQATTLDDLNGVMRSLMKSALERMLNTELEVHLGRGPSVGAATIETSPAPDAGRDPRRRNARTAPVRRRFRATWESFPSIFRAIARERSSRS